MKDRYQKKALVPFFQKLIDKNITFYNLYDSFSKDQKIKYYFKEIIDIGIEREASMFQLSSIIIFAKIILKYLITSAVS